MLKVPRHLRKLHESTFIIFFHHFEARWSRKYLRYWTLKSYVFLLTYWLPITSILFRIVRICRSLFQCSYLKNEKLAVCLLFHLWNLHQILNIFRTKKVVIANVFPKLQTVKDLFRALSKKRRFRISFETQHAKGSLRLAKFTWENFYHIFLPLSRGIILRVSALLKYEILGVFVNTLANDYKYPVPDCENLLFPI